MSDIIWKYCRKRIATAETQVGLLMFVVGAVDDSIVYIFDLYASDVA